MCYNKNVSIAAYVTSTILGLTLFKIGDKYDKNIAVFMLVLNQMQLAEYFMWIDQKCGKMNHYASIYAHIIILFEPIAILVGALIYNTFCLPNIYVYILLGILVIPLISAIIMIIKNKRKLCSKEEETGYLEWDLVSPSYPMNKLKIFNRLSWIMIMILSWLFFKNKLKGFLMFLMLISTFLFSRIDIANMDFNFDQWESKWCIIGVGCPLIFLLLKLF